VSVEDIESLSGILCADPHARKKYSSLLQLADIASRCIRDGDMWNKKSKAEQVARLSAEDGPESLSSLIIDELRAAKEGTVSVCDTLRHLMIGSCWMKSYHSSDEVLSEEQRAAITEALADAYQDRQGCESMPWIPEHGSFDLMEVSRQAVDTICGLPARYGVDCLINDILRRRQVPAMKHVGTSIAGLFKAGLGKIGLQDHSPGDYDVILIFVLGGVSATDISEIRASVDRSGTNAKVVVGGSSLCPDPSVILKSVFCE